jgi:DUF2911 family protein
MKAIKLLLVFFFATAISCAQESPREKAEGSINKVNISIDYGAPSVKGRTVWGGLEKYGNVWRAGANENTTISFDKDVHIAGKKLAAGKYGFFIIPVENGHWTVIFNKVYDAWGAFSYDQKEDALRVNISPKFVDETQEQLLYTVDSKSITMAWDKARLSIPVK